MKKFFAKKWMPFWVFVLILATDQLFKFYVKSTLIPNEAYPIFGLDWFQLTRIPNGGIIFHEFSTLGEGQNEFYIRYLPTCALAVFLPLYRLFRGPLVHRIEIIGVSAFMSGGFSNVLDHWLSYFVDDNLKIRIWPFPEFHPFNLADSAIIFGLICIFFGLLTDTKRAFEPVAMMP